MFLRSVRWIPAGGSNCWDLARECRDDRRLDEAESCGGYAKAEDYVPDGGRYGGNSLGSSFCVAGSAEAPPKCCTRRSAMRLWLSTASPLRVVAVRDGHSGLLTGGVGARQF